MPALEPCWGCKALVPVIDGPTHAYAGASAGCWAIFGELQARTMSLTGDHLSVLRLMVDAYASQHPGTPSRRSIQSVASHLIVLCCYIERGFPVSDANTIVAKAVAQASHFVWLEPPADPGAITVLDVYNAAGEQELAERVEAWIRSVWAAWSAHHDTIRKWADLALLAPKHRF